MSTPPTKAEREAAELAWKHRQIGQAQLFVPELTAGASGWYTIPKPVRFVVWVYTILALIGIVAAVIGVLVWVLIFGAALSTL